MHRLWGLAAACGFAFNSLTVLLTPASAVEPDFKGKQIRLIVGAAQIFFLYNLVWSYFRGKPSGPNPWNATTLEWQTADTPPQHGNFGDELPVVYRWAYDFSVPGAEQDFIPQNVAPRDVVPSNDKK